MSRTCTRSRISPARPSKASRTPIRGCGARSGTCSRVPAFSRASFSTGRRVRYLPPFRLYLVISVLFFLIVGLPEGVAIDVDGTTHGRARRRA